MVFKNTGDKEDHTSGILNVMVRAPLWVSNTKKFQETTFSLFTYGKHRIVHCRWKKKLNLCDLGREDKTKRRKYYNSFLWKHLKPFSKRASYFFPHRQLPPCPYHLIKFSQILKRPNSNQYPKSFENFLFITIL